MDASFDVVALLSDLQVVAYVKVACLSLLIYDTVITLDHEYRYIWQRKWHFVKILYIFTRYSTFIDTTSAVYERLDQNFTDCHRLMTFNTIFSGFGIGLSEIILMIRTYALYDSSKKVLFFFIIMWFAIGGVNFWAVTKWTGSYTSHTQPVHPELGPSMQCYLGNANSVIGLVCYLSLLAGETVIVLMTVVKAISTWRKARFLNTQGVKSSRLITSFYLEGILFYFFILPFTILNVVAILSLSEGLLLVVDTPLRVLHTILTCRLVIHLRHIADLERFDWEGGEIGSLKFQTMSEPSELGNETLISQRDLGSEHV